MQKVISLFETKTLIKMSRLKTIFLPVFLIQVNKSASLTSLIEPLL